MATGFAALVGPAVVNQMIDGYVTPQAIAALARNENVKPGDAAPNIDKTVRQIGQVQWDQVKYAFFSGGPLTFRLDILPPNDPQLQGPASLEFSWNGDWRLVRVTLPPDALGPDSSSASRLLNRTAIANVAPELKSRLQLKNRRSRQNQRQSNLRCCQSGSSRKTTRRLTIKLKYCLSLQSRIGQPSPSARLMEFLHLPIC